MEKTNSEKNKQDSFVIADSPTTSFYLKKKIEKKKQEKTTTNIHEVTS